MYIYSLKFKNAHMQFNIIIISLILFGGISKSNAQQFVIDSIIQEKIQHSQALGQYPSLIQAIELSEKYNKHFDTKQTLVEINTYLALANILDTTCIFYQKAKTAVNKYLQYETKNEEKTDENNLEYVKKLQFNLFKEGFLFDLYTKMETYQTALYFIGSKSYKSALKYLEMAISQDNPLALYKMAELYLADKIGETDEQKDQAIHYFEMAAENQFVMAVPAILKIKMDDTEDPTHIIEEYKELIEFGVSMQEPISMYFKGKYLLTKANYQAKNITNNDAYIYLTKAASYDVYEAMEELIWMHCKGVGIFASKNEAFYWLEKLKKKPNISNAKILEFEDCIKSL